MTSLGNGAPGHISCILKERVAAHVSIRHASCMSVPAAPILSPLWAVFWIHQKLSMVPHLEQHKRHVRQHACSYITDMTRPLSKDELPGLQENK